MITTYAKEQIAYRIGSNIAIPSRIAVGTGSAVVSATRSGLITEFTRGAFTNGSINFANLQKVSFQIDFSSTTMSGCSMKEFGVFDLASGGKAWSVEGFPATLFDGSQEVTIEVQYIIY